MPTYTSPGRARCNDEWAIHLQRRHRCAANAGLSDHLQAVGSPCKVLVPGLRAWIEQWSDYLRFWIKCLNEHELEAIAIDTSQAQIVQRAFTAQPTRHDVIYLTVLTAQELSGLTILAAMLCSLANVSDNVVG